MEKKRYQKPEIKDFPVGYVSGEITPSGLCSLGNWAGGSDACSDGNEPDPTYSDCSGGTRPQGLCTEGATVTTCYTGTYA